MTDTVQVPGAGAVPRNVLIVIGAGGAAFVGYSYWKRRQQPVTGTVDVNSGIGATAYTGTPNTAGATGNATVNAGMPTTINTNADWTQAATTYLEAHGNFDGAALTAALGKYLTRDPGGLTDAEVAMVQAARGAFGEPPVGGPYSIIHAAPSTPTSDGNDFPSDGPGLPPPGNPGQYNPHIWIARPGDTALNVVPRMYAFDPAVNPPTAANLPRRTGVAQAIIATNQHIMPPGINDPIPAGTAITYY
jgi:hypothetical protein